MFLVADDLRQTQETGFRFAKLVQLRGVEAPGASEKEMTFHRPGGGPTGVGIPNLIEARVHPPGRITCACARARSAGPPRSTLCHAQRVLEKLLHPTDELLALSAGDAAKSCNQSIFDLVGRKGRPIDGRRLDARQSHSASPYGKPFECDALKEPRLWLDA